MFHCARSLCTFWTGGLLRAVQVVAELRKSLHFASPLDPRLAVPDRKQKGRVLGSAEDPEHRLLEAAKQAMQLSSTAADAIVKELRAVAGKCWGGMSN